MKRMPEGKMSIGDFQQLNTNIDKTMNKIFDEKLDPLIQGNKETTEKISILMKDLFKFKVIWYLINEPAWRSETNSKDMPYVTE